MTGSTPAQLAAEAAESVRALNHATRPGTGGLVFPADAYDVTGALSLLASRLPQALAQLLTFLRTEAEAGRVDIVAGGQAGDPAAVLAAVTASLDTAVAAARQLHQSLDTAQNQLTWAAARSEWRPLLAVVPIGANHAGKDHAQGWRLPPSRSATRAQRAPGWPGQDIQSAVLIGMPTPGRRPPWHRGSRPRQVPQALRQRARLPPRPGTRVAAARAAGCP